MPYVDKDGRMCGFLNIEEIENSAHFQRRYFRLEAKDGKLQYFMDNPSNLDPKFSNPVGEINLQYVSRVNDGRKLRPKIEFLFVINFAGRRYFLQADDEADMTKWIEVLNNASKVTVPRSHTQRSGSHEWHPGDKISTTPYTAEIAGGVFCKIPLQAEGSESDSTVEDGPAPGDKALPAHSIPAIKAGFCVKQGAVRRNWKRRYFVLHENGLSYFRSDSDKVPIKTIQKSDVFESKVSTGLTHRDNVFEVITAKRIFLVQCDTPEEMQSWITAVKAACAMQSQDQQKSLQDHRQGLPLTSEKSATEEVVSNSKGVWQRDKEGQLEVKASRQRKKSWHFW